MNAAEQLVEALKSRRPMNHPDAVRLVRQAQADALHATADRMANRHVGLISAYAATEQLHQDADALCWGDPIGGAAA